MAVHVPKASVKVTETDALIARDSILALSVATPVVDDLTVKLALPAESVVDAIVAITSVIPRLEANVTDLPETGFPFASRAVTEIVEAAFPSAITLVGFADNPD